MLKAFCIALLALFALSAKLFAQERYLVSYAGFGGFQAPAWAAKDFGLFTKYGLNIDLVMVPGSTRGTQALLGGSTQFGQIDGTALITAINQGADLVITVTASRQPLVRAEWLSSGVTVIAVGSDSPDKQELYEDVLAHADKIVADSVPQCLRLGEIHHAVERGAIAREKIYAELGEITAGLKPGRVSEDEIIVCDLTGVGVQDVAAASLVMKRAEEKGMGRRIDL